MTGPSWHSPAPDATSLLVQLVNYGAAPSESITVRAAAQYRSARLFTPGAPPADLKINQQGERIEVRIAKIAVCAALQLEK